MQKVGMTPLLVLGAVFGVLQVALGVEMMANGWQAWSAAPRGYDARSGYC
jgi:small neutral amino acid transporter SnatA (MarC family)